MEKLKISISADKTDWTADFNQLVFDYLIKNPFFSEWETMRIGSNSLNNQNYDYQKLLNALISAKKEICIEVYGKDTSIHSNCICINRTKHYYYLWLQIEQEYLNSFETINQFKDYIIELALRIPKFERITTSTIHDVDIQKKYNIPDEKSFFLTKNWLDVLSPLVYESHYEKVDLLNTPYYHVEEIAPNIIMIQAYKDPFDLENEESLNYLRNGVEYLNKHIVYLKGK